MKEGKCPVCGATFTSASNRAKIYCSRECKNKGYSDRKKESYKQKNKIPEVSETNWEEYHDKIVNYAERQKAQTIAMIWGNRY